MSPKAGHGFSFSIPTAIYNGAWKPVSVIRVNRKPAVYVKDGKETSEREGKKIFTPTRIDLIQMMVVRHTVHNDFEKELLFSERSEVTYVLMQTKKPRGKHAVMPKPPNLLELVVTSHAFVLVWGGIYLYCFVLSV